MEGRQANAYEHGGEGRERDERGGRVVNSDIMGLF